MTDWWQANPLPVGRAVPTSAEYSIPPSTNAGGGRNAFCWHCLTGHLTRNSGNRVSASCSTAWIKVFSGRGFAMAEGLRAVLAVATGCRLSLAASSRWRQCRQTFSGRVPKNRRNWELQFMVPNFVAKLGGSKWAQAQPASVPYGFSTGKRILSWLTLLW